MTENLTSNSTKIAIVGMTGSGKTVLISTLATKMSQMALEGIFLIPEESNRRQTLLYMQSNWNTLNQGRWPASTPAGELIELKWELDVNNQQALIQFLDCAGQDIRSLFRTDNFNPDRLRGDLKRVYDNINSANILIFLVNMKDLLATPDYVEEFMDLDQMLHTLNQRKDIPRKMAIVFSQYDKYKPEVDQEFNGDFLEYLRHYIPLLHSQYIHKRNFEIIPVAAVNDTRSVIENGVVKQYPVPNFSSYNLETLIYWIADSVEELAPAIRKYWRKQLLRNAKPAPVEIISPEPVHNTYNPGDNQQSGANTGVSIGKAILKFFKFLFFAIYFILVTLFFTAIIGSIFAIIGTLIYIFNFGFSGCSGGAQFGFFLGFILSICIATGFVIYNINDNNNNTNSNTPLHR